MNKTYKLKNIVLKSVFILFILLMSFIMISCSPVDENLGKEEPQNIVDAVVEKDEEEEEPEEVKEEEQIIEYIVENPLITYIKDDGLYFSYLDDGIEMRMHEAQGISNPRISPDGNFIAYTFEDGLYVYNLEVKDYGKVEDGVLSYAFADDYSIIFSDINRGLTKFHLITGDKIQVEDDFIYEDLTYAKEGIMYGKRVYQWADNMGMYADNVGIVEINLENLDTELIIDAKRDSEEELGYDPSIFHISKDGRYVYLMEKFQSGSMSADFGSVGVYDYETKKHSAFENIYDMKEWSEDDLIVLPRWNNLTINPQKGNVISVVMGGGREMIFEKEVVILDIEENKSYELVKFMEDGFVGKTPSFSLDGKKLYYSATEAIDTLATGDYGDEFKDWFIQAHNIYEYNMETLEVSKLTQEMSFDFMPISRGDSILYFRAQDYIPEHFSLIQWTDGVEEILIEDIIFKDQFYGSIQTGTSMDILLNSKKF